MFFRRKPQAAKPVTPVLPVGPIYNAACAVDPGDRLRVRSQTGGTLRKSVTVGVQHGSDFDFVVLTPGNARRVAAAILNAADEVDGYKPLFPTLNPQEVTG